MMNKHIFLLIVGCVFVNGQDPISAIDHPHPHPDPRGPGGTGGLRLPSIISETGATGLASGSTNTVGDVQPGGISVTGDGGVSSGTEPTGSAETPGFMGDVGGTMNVGAPGDVTMGRSGGFIGSSMNAGGFVADPLPGGANGMGRITGTTMNRVAPGTGGFAMGGRVQDAGRFSGSMMNRGTAGLPGGMVGGTMNTNTMRGLSDPLRVGGASGGRAVRMQTLGGTGSPAFRGGLSTDRRFIGQSGFVGGDMGGAGIRGGMRTMGSRVPTIRSERGPLGASVTGGTFLHSAGGTRATFLDEQGNVIPDPSASLSARERDLLMRGGMNAGEGPVASLAGSRNTLTPGLSTTGTMASTVGMPGGVHSGSMLDRRGLGPIMERGAPGTIDAGVRTGASFVGGAPMSGVDPLAGGPRFDPFTGRPIAGMSGAPIIGTPGVRTISGSALAGRPFIGPRIAGSTVPGTPLIGTATLPGTMAGLGFGSLATGGAARFIPATGPPSVIGRLPSGAIRTVDGRLISGGGATAGAIYPTASGVLPTGIATPGFVYPGLDGSFVTGGTTLSTGGAISTDGGATTLPDGVLMGSGNASSAADGPIRIGGGSPFIGLTGTPGAGLPPGTVVLPGADMRGSGLGRVVYERSLLPIGGGLGPGLFAPGTPMVGTGFRYLTPSPFAGSRILPGSSTIFPAGGLRYLSGGPIFRPGTIIQKLNFNPVSLYVVTR